MRFGAYLLIAALGIAALASSCDSLECGAGTHEEQGRCVANVDPVCSCGPGTVRVENDLACQCEVAPSTCGAAAVWDGDGGVCRPVDADAPLAAVRACGCLARPVGMCNISMPGPCVVETGYPLLVMATVSDDYGRPALVGGFVTATAGDGGIGELRGLENQFLLDGQPAAVPLAVESDGSFVTDPGAQLFEWDFLTEPSQPSLPLRNVSVTGGLDVSGRPDLGGRLTGCFRLEDAAAIRVEVFSQTFAELTVAAGATPDCDPTGSGNLDGYTFELSWWTGEAADVYE